MKHLDIGTIHAFLDGELSGDDLEFAAQHFSLCDACSNLMLEAEGESDAVMQAFAVENVCVVPTQRIWARINNEIDLLEAVPAAAPQPVSSWHNAANWFGLNRFARFAVPSSAFALGVALVAFFTFYSFNPENPVVTSPAIAGINESKPVVTVIDAPISVKPTPNESVNVASINRTETNAAKRATDFVVTKASYRVEEKPRTFARKPVKENVKKVDLNAPLVEERLYLDAINDLSQTVASTDAEVMRPSVRVEYEQNIALMDKAIDKMQKQVRRNPKDENAKRILFASYQNKIDLLNTVAEKSQLMATLR